MEKGLLWFFSTWLMLNGHGCSLHSCRKFGASSTSSLSVKQPSHVTCVAIPKKGPTVTGLLLVMLKQTKQPVSPFLLIKEGCICICSSIYFERAIFQSMLVFWSLKGFLFRIYQMDHKEASLACLQNLLVSPNGPFSSA